MKTAITGHTAGLGKAIAERLQREGHEVKGFALENGYDVTSPEGVVRIVEEALDCDCFVNCAYDRRNHGNWQITMLTYLFHYWQDEEKHIVNIGSNAPDNFSRNAVPAAIRYRAAKTALDAAVVELNQLWKPCRVSLVRPNWMVGQAATEFEQHNGFKLAKLELEEVAEVVAKILELGPSITIQSITLTRSMKAKKPEKPRRRWWRRG